MLQLVADRVEDLLLRTDSRLKEVQYECAPYLATSIELKDVYKYYYKNELRTVTDYSFRYFRVTGLKLTNQQKSKVRYSRIDKLKNLVDDSILCPFLLFNYGVVIPWSNIEVVLDYNYTYIKVKNMGKANVDLKIIEFPCNVRYGEDDDILDPSEYSVAMYFGADGTLTTSDSIAVRLEVIDKNISGSMMSMSFSKPYISLELESGVSIQKEAIIPFKDGYLTPEIQDDIVSMGFDIYKSASNQFSKRIYFVFYYNSALSSSNNVFKDTIDSTNMKKFVESNILSAPKEYITRLFQSSFDYSFSNKTTYAKNIANAIEYITSYNANLFDPVYEKLSKIFKFKYSGSDFLALKKGNLVSLHRRMNGGFNNYIMLFINGKLYDYNYEIVYADNYINIPIKVAIADNDLIEIIYFTEVCNSVSDFTLEKSKSVYISPEVFDARYIEMYSQYADSTASYTPYYDVDFAGKRTQYQLDYTMSKSSSGNNMYDIGLEHDSYYSHPITFASKRQFRYARYTKTEYEQGDYYFLLPTDFNYCHNKAQYMVFINGLLMSKNNFTVTSTSESRPFDKLYLYITTTLVDSDILEVFYVPDEMEDIIVAENMSLSGDIVIDGTQVSVPLSKENYFVFVNGKKVENDQITNVTRSKMRIRTDQGSTNNIVVMRYTDAIDELATAYSNTTADEWSDLLDSLSQDEKNELMNIALANLPEGDNYMKDHSSLGVIVNDIIAAYYIIRSKVNLTEKMFIYDFELDSVKLDDGGATNIVALDTLAVGPKQYIYLTNNATNDNYNLAEYKFKTSK